jgi:hypothetical protein
MKNIAVKSDSWQGINLLDSVGLKPQWFTEIGLKTLAAYRQTTIHDALNASGSFAYFAAVRAIRDVLCVRGWEIERQCNLELTVNGDKNIKVIVSSGNEDTGILDGHPKTKNPKGNQTKKAVIGNMKQITFHEYNEKFKIEIKLTQDEDLNPTWIFLYHIGNSEMRMELSLPTKINFQDMRVSDWNQRIIFPSIDFKPPITFGDQGQDSVEVVVKRKQL